MSKQQINEAAKAHFLKTYLHPKPRFAEMIWKRLYASDQVVFVPSTSKRKAHYKLARLPKQ